MGDGRTLRSHFDPAALAAFKGCARSVRAILDEAAWHMENNADARGAFVERLAALSNYFERAMVTFLDHNPF